MFMKIILLTLIAVVFSVGGMAQTYSIPSTDFAAGTYSDPPGSTQTYVSSGITVWRRATGATVRYNHLNSLFLVDGRWFTQFNDGPNAGDWGMPGNNTDYFLYQGDNEIAGDGGIIVFDTVHFDIGNNTMSITNYNVSSANPLNFYRGQPPGGIVIAKKLLFNNGITTTNRENPLTGAIVFVNNADYTGGLTDAQHVNGYVSEVNNENNPQVRGHAGNFTFPVGSDNAVYQLNRQGVFEETDSILTVSWINMDPNLPGTEDPTQNSHNLTDNLPEGITAIAKQGFWDWHFQESDNITGAALAMVNDQIITVSIPDLSGYPGLQANQLRLIGYDPIIGSWIDLSGGPNATGLAKGSTLQGTIPGGQVISAIAIGSTNNVILPVSFSAFTVKADGCKALLEWQTGMEQNNSHFVVERSTNGNDFTAIGRVGAVGNSNSLNTYRFTDEAPSSGVNYYRITQVDFDGKHSSTDIKAIRIQCNGNAVAIKAYPNPATSQVNIQSGKAVAQVNVVSSNGQTVMKYVPSQNQGGTFSLNIQRVQKGIYLLQVVNKDGTVDVIKLLKQ
jgi:hypothetical protein